MITDVINLKIGDKVYYQPEHYRENDEFENGMIKEIPLHTNTSVRVVYNCAGNWDNFKDYTSALTNLRDLTLGWKHKNEINIGDLTDANSRPYKGYNKNPELG